MMKKLLILPLLLVIHSGYGQYNPSPEQEKPGIEVTGVAEKEIVPDEIYITIVVRERQEGKDKITIEKQESDLREALKSIGVPMSDLSISDADANYTKVKWTRKDVIAKVEYLLKVSDAKMVGKVFEKLDAVNIHEAHISKVTHSKIDEFRKEVRIMAIKAAKAKADYLLEAIGEKAGKAIKVYELQGPVYNQGLYTRNAMAEAGKKSFSENEIEPALHFTKIKLEARIYVKFEIRQ